MFITRKNEPYFISYIEKPHRIWYPINLEIPRYGEDYVKSKLGVTDPIKQRDLRIEFYEAIRNPKDIIESNTLEPYFADYGRFAVPFYIHKNAGDSVTVFIEKGFQTLKHNPETGAWEHGDGYPWGVIDKSDSPDEIAFKFYDDDIEFGASMKEELNEIMGW